MRPGSSTAGGVYPNALVELATRVHLYIGRKPAGTGVSCQ